jgi:decaprenyl-phosphate phosphoribosyltransferase
MKKFIFEDFIQIIRVNEWYKQVFIIPGIILALVIDKNSNFETLDFIICLMSINFAASANYLINEYLDKQYDKFHPIKKKNSLKNKINSREVIYIYLILALIAFIYPIINGKNSFILFQTLFLISGVFYNVKPFRLKDKKYIDTLFESLNNPLRLFLGFSIISEQYLIIPISVILSYFFFGAFLMNSKRLSEYNFLKNKIEIKKYRKSLAKYDQPGELEAINLLYSLITIFFVTIFLIKYKISLLPFVFLLIYLMTYYFKKSLITHSFVHRPEFIYKDKKFILLIILTSIFFY